MGLRGAEMRMLEFDEDWVALESGEEVDEPVENKEAVDNIEEVMAVEDDGEFDEDTRDIQDKVEG